MIDYCIYIIYYKLVEIIIDITSFVVGKISNNMMKYYGISDSIISD